MANITIRNIPDDVHRAICAQAKRHGRSAEAEVRQILQAATQPASGLRFGDELAALGRAVGSVELYTHASYCSEVFSKTVTDRICSKV